MKVNFLLNDTKKITDKDIMDVVANVISESSAMIMAVKDIIKFTHCVRCARRRFIAYQLTEFHCLGMTNDTLY